MIQELAEKVWRNPRFQRSAKTIERKWLMEELRLPESPFVSERTASKAMSSAAILACSNNLQHRIAALRLSTYIYEIFEDSNLPFDSALRVVLARLGNFPSFATRAPIQNALSTLPLSLATEELAAADRHTITFEGERIALTSFQHLLWSDLASNRSVALSAPTSGGKSFVLELYLAYLFQAGAPRVAYVVPTRALIAQVAKELGSIFSSRRLSAPELLTVPLDSDSDVPDRAIFIMTQERLHLTLQSHPDIRVDVIVIDEAHSVSEGSRGILLQTVIEELLSRNPRAQTLFASPTTKNLEAFGRLFGHPNVSQRPSKEPTVSQNFVVVETRHRGEVSISAIRDTGREITLGEIEIGLSLRSRIEKLAHIPVSLCDGQPNLVYANGADEAEEIALLIAKRMQRIEGPATPRLDALSRLAKESVHSKYVLAECVEKGVGFHYANIPTNLRQEIEAAFRAGILKYLVCTSTLLQGVNLPAKNLFLMKPTKGQGSPLQSPDFWNLAGRAGRMLREFQGNIFLINYGDWSTHPLGGPKDIEIESAIEKNIKQSMALLKNTINGKPSRLSPSKKIELETAFVRLFTDLRYDRLDETLSRLDLSEEEKSELKGELRGALKTISLPVEILRKTHNVSAHRQERLYQRIKGKILEAPDNLEALLPLPPTDRRAFQSYSDILELCHEVILGIDTSRKLHRFHALLARRWMSGWSIPRIINSAINRMREREVKEIKFRQDIIDTRKIIRETLQVIEEAIRFQTIRLFGCYRTILAYALREIGEIKLSEQILDVELFLEIGASSKTMVSLISLGLSRTVAIKLNGARSDLDPELDKKEALEWLRSISNRLATLGLSDLQVSEVTDIILQADKRMN